MDMGLGCENLALTVKMSSVWILRRETECALIFAFGLSNMDFKKKFFLLLLVELDLKIPSVKVYLLWDLIGQLAWVKRKDSEGHSHETKTHVDKDKGGQGQRTNNWNANAINKQQRHIKRHTRICDSPASCFWVSVRYERPRQHDDLHTVTRFCVSVCVRSCESKI